VRQLLARVESATGRRWVDVLGGQLHFSEWTLYGVFVDEVLGPPAKSFATDDPLCHPYWEETPLDGRTVREFLDRVGPEDIAVMISAKSRTPLSVRRAALRDLAG
jgi:hypothetical protein